MNVCVRISKSTSQRARKLRFYVLASLDAHVFEEINAWPRTCFVPKTSERQWFCTLTLTLPSCVQQWIISRHRLSSLAIFRTAPDLNKRINMQLDETKPQIRAVAKAITTVRRHQYHSGTVQANKSHPSTTLNVVSYYEISSQTQQQIPMLADLNDRKSLNGPFFPADLSILGRRPMLSGQSSLPGQQFVLAVVHEATQRGNKRKIATNILELT